MLRRKPESILSEKVQIPITLFSSQKFEPCAYTGRSFSLSTFVLLWTCEKQVIYHQKTNSANIKDQSNHPIKPAQTVSLRFLHTNIRKLWRTGMNAVKRTGDVYLGMMIVTLYDCDFTGLRKARMYMLHLIIFCRNHFDYNGNSKADCRSQRVPIGYRASCVMFMPCIT